MTHTPIGFEGLSGLDVAQDILDGFAQLDYLKAILDRRELYSEFCLTLGSALMGPATYFEATEPFMPPGITLRVLSEPTTRGHVRRFSVDTLLGPDNSGLSTEMEDDQRPPTPQFTSALLRDYLIDIERRTLRIGESTIGKRMDGRLAMTSKDPTLLEPTDTEGGSTVVSVFRGRRFEAALFSLPPVSDRTEAMALQGFLKLQPFLTQSFQQNVGLQYHFAENDVAY